MRWIIGLLAIAALAIFIPYYLAIAPLKPLTDDARASAPGAFVELTDGQVHYLDLGPRGGDPIVMVHGFSTPHFIFRQNAEALATAGHRVILFDHFGRGWSDRPGGRYDAEFYVRELKDLLDALDLTGPVDLVGLSMGGVIVPEFTVRHPDRVRRVALLVPAGLDVAGDASAMTVRLLRMPVIGDYLWTLNARSTLLNDPQYDETGVAEANRLQGDVAEQMAYKGYFPALLSSFRHLPMAGRTDLFAALAETGVPVLAIYGEEDPTVAISSAEKMNSLVPEADVRTIRNGDHGLNYKRHRKVNRWLIDFFAPEASMALETPQ